jgi:tetratricopeptide (TPR) repeat protein
MKRWLIPLLFLLAPAPAQATPQFHMTVALQDIRAGRDGDALYYLTRAIQERGLKADELADALEWRAFLHAKRGNLRAARADLDAAIAAEADNPLRRRARARFFLRTGDYRAALRDMEELMTRFETDAENYADLCEALLGLGRRAEAIDNCQRGVRVDPEHARPRMLLRRARGR